MTPDVERKRFEEALRASESRLAAIVDSAMDAIISIDADQRITIFNAAAERMFRCPAQSTIGQPLDRFIPQRFRSAHNAHIQHFGKTGVTGRSMTRPGTLLGLRVDGEEFPIEATISQAEVGGEKIYTVIIRDVTERKRAEEARHELELRFRATFDQAAVGIAHVSLDGRWLVVNQKLCEIAGYSREELLAGTFQDITYPDDLGPNLDYVGRLLAGEIQTFTMEKRYITKAGPTVWVNLTVSLVREDSGEPKYFIAVVEDITRRKRVEEALRASEERFRALVQNASDVIAVLEVDGTVSYVSSSVDRVFGYPASRVLGTNGFAYVHPDDVEQTRRQMADLLDEPGAVRRFEFRVQMRKDCCRDVEAVCCNLLLDPVVRGIVVNARDITERRALERQKDEFLSVAAHELKTPVTSLRGFAQLALRRTDRQGNVDLDQTRRSLKVIDQQASKLSRLVIQLLDVARIQAGRLTIDPRLVDVTTLVAEVVETTQATTARHRMYVRSSGPAPACVDPLRIEQVITNLLDNAIKYSPEGGPIEVEVSQPTSDWVRITVTDRGLGIAPEHRDRIFESGYRAHTHRHLDGMGLGLYISRQILNLHGGQIAAAFPDEVGTRIIVMLPTHLASESADLEVAP